MPIQKRGLDDNEVAGPSKRRKLAVEIDNEETYPQSATEVSSSHDDYTVGWICALPPERAAAEAMLDEIHPNLPIPSGDHNAYTLGKIGVHNVVIACMPSGVYGTTSATTVATQLLSTFRSIRFGLMVGIGGGAPNKVDIRLGDVVVSKPADVFGGVVPYDSYKNVGPGDFKRVGTLNKPPQVLLTAITKLQAEHRLRPSSVPVYLREAISRNPTSKPFFSYPNHLEDRLFEAEYEHPKQEDPCEQCDLIRLVSRPTRADNSPVIHYGLIASGNQVMKHGITRDSLTRELGIICFEMEAAGLMDAFPCLVIRGICDYSDSHKNKQWQDYAAGTAAAYAKEVLSVVAPAQLKATPAAATTLAHIIEQICTIADWITPANFSAQQIDILAKRQDGTGLWLLSSPEYKDWLQGNTKTLFCPGIPGAGKTIMSSIVVEDLQTVFSRVRGVAITCLFCNYKIRTEQRSSDLLAGFLKQLVQQCRSLPPELEAWYEKHLRERTRPAFSDLSNALRTCLDHFSSVYLVIDALDECENREGDRHQLLHELFRLQRDYKVRILATSRFLPDIEKEFEGSMRLEIRASPEDVARYLSSHMAAFPASISRNPGLQETIKKDIINAVDGMFLLAHLHLDSLKDKMTPKAVRTALERLPKGSAALDAAYAEAMERIQAQKPGFRRLATQVLSWIICATEPLTTTKLQHALGVEPDEPELDNDNLPYVEDMVSVCAGLVTVDNESGVIRLVHYTTQEYFQKTRTEWFPEAQKDVAHGCLNYLSLDSFRLGPCESKEEFYHRRYDYPLYEYAAINWGYHVQEASVTESQQFILKFLENEANVGSAAQALFAYDWSKDDPFFSLWSLPSEVTAVHLAAWFGLTQVVAVLLQRGYELDRKDNDGQTPLTWAAERGQTAVVNLLVEKGAQLESRAQKRRTPLSLAAGYGHATTVEALLQNGANPASCDLQGLTPLLWASRSADDEVGAEVAKLLLSRPDVNVNKGDLYGRPPLAWAAKVGNGKVVETLLTAQGIDPNIKDRSGRTPLSVAAAYGKTEVARLLLARADVDINTKDEMDQTPLSLTVRHNRTEVAKLLLARNDVTINATDITGGTPLSLAARSGQTKVAKLLLARDDVNVNAKDSMGWTPLSVAVAYGKTEVTKLLLARADVDINTKDEMDQTPLSLALKRNGTEVAKLLLARNDVTINATDNTGRTPLSLAARSGQTEVAKLLLARGDVNVNAKDNMGQTPLSLAAEFRNTEVAKLLLARDDVDPDLKDHQGQTPLSLAAGSGETAVAKLLLARDDVNPDSADHRGRTPLSWAASGGYTKVVKLLLARDDVDVNAKDARGQTPLSLAARSGQTEVAKLLLARGDIDPDSTDHLGQTPLSWAASRGYTEVAKLLLAREDVDPDTKDIIGRTPLDYAEAQKHLDYGYDTAEVVELLRSHREKTIKNNGG